MHRLIFDLTNEVQRNGWITNCNAVKKMYAISWPDLFHFRGYLVVCPRKIRPDQTFRIFVTIYKMYHKELDVKAVLSRNSVEYASSTVPFTREGTKQIELKVDLFGNPLNNKSTAGKVYSFGTEHLRNSHNRVPCHAKCFRLHKIRTTVWSYFVKKKWNKIVIFNFD